MSNASALKWRTRDRIIDVSSRTLVMAIVNVTPDSFSDGGKYFAIDAALQAAQQFAADGADILDIGGESTRPGRLATVDAREEISRVVPVIKSIRDALPGQLISVDTYKAEVADAALHAGADIVNDIYALRGPGGNMPEVVSRHGVAVILMHMQGTPETMQLHPSYQDAVRDVSAELARYMETAMAAGIAEEQICIDPGIGFGKAIDHNLQLIARLREFEPLGRPICVGASRKGFLGKLTGDAPVTDREEATVAASCAAAINGAHIIRTHNPRGARRALAVIDAIKAAGPTF